MPAAKRPASKTAKPSKKRTKQDFAPVDDGDVIDVDCDDHEIASKTAIADRFSKTACLKWFKSYATNPKNFVLDRPGLTKLFQNIGIPDDNVLALILSQKFGVVKFDDPVTQTAFLSFMSELECDSDEKLKRQLPTLLAASRNRTNMLALCTYAFNLVKEPGEKNIAKNLAQALFGIMLKEWTLLETFVKFYEDSSHRSLSLDTFKGLCDLALQYPSMESLKAYNDELGWVSLADEFVESVKKAQSSVSKAD